MSDTKFSVDDILNEYSKRKDEPPKPKSTFDIDELMSYSKQVKEKSKKFEFDSNESIKKEMLFDNTQSILNQYSKTTKNSEVKDTPSYNFDNTQSILTQYSKATKNTEDENKSSNNLDNTQSILTQYSKTTKNTEDKNTSYSFDNTQSILSQYSKSTDIAKAENKDDLSAYLGNTQSILKQYSKKNDDVSSSENDDKASDKELKSSSAKVHNKHDNSQVASLEEKLSKANVKPIRTHSGNTEIIEGILKLKKERVTSKTAELVPINRKNINDIHLDITSKIIPKTEQITIPEDADEITKQNMLAEKRKKKIKDFVLSTNIDEEEEEPEITEDKYATVEDFNDIEDAPLIVNEISQIKSTLVIRFCFLFISTILTSYITFANDFGWPILKLLDISKSPSSFLLINIVIGVLSLLICGSVITNGLAGFFKFKADCDSLPAIAISTSIIASIIFSTNTELIKSNKIHIYIPVAIACLLFNTIGKLLIVFRTERNFKYISDDNEKYALFQVEDTEKASKFTRGALSGYPSLTAMKKTGFVEDFMKSSFAADLSDSFCKRAAPAIFFSSLAIALISIVMNNNLDMTSRIFSSLSTFAGTIALCSSFAVMLIVNLPFARTSKRLLQSSACMIGYDAVEEFNDTNSVLIDVNQLFPEGSVELVNLKQLSSTTVEEGILVAASLACHAGSILKSTFYKMLKGNTELLYPVESYLYEDTLGLSGWIGNKRVLLGTRELMKNHSIEGLPSTAKEADYAKKNLVLYLSISGEVTMMFIVKVKASLGVSKWLRELEKQDITVILRSVDSIISLNFLSEIFKVSADKFKLIPFRHHQDFEEQTAYTSKISSPMICSGRFQPFAMLVTHAKNLNKTAIMGMFLILTSCIMGGLLSLCMTFLSSFSQITASVALLFNMGWVALVYLFLSFRRN